MRLFHMDSGTRFRFRLNEERTTCSLHFRSERPPTSVHQLHSRTWKFVAVRNAEGLWLACEVCGHIDLFREHCPVCSSSKEEMRRLARRAKRLLRQRRDSQSRIIYPLDRLTNESRGNKVDEREEEVCAICLEKLGNLDTVSKLVCEHLFHTNCITTWIQRQPSCPYCRATLDGNNP